MPGFRGHLHTSLQPYRPHSSRFAERVACPLRKTLGDPPRGPRTALESCRARTKGSLHGAQLATGADRAASPGLAAPGFDWRGVVLSLADAPDETRGGR